jgi:protein-S-isoprenylcysteine O-methyltransferase Ste14
MSTHRPQTAPQPPESDVSSGVGIAGLLGLFVWLFVCRNWPAISPALGLGEGPGRLNGPDAALACVFACAVPMVAWSLFVDKVHRRPSTGIDWTLNRPLRDVIDVSITKLAGLWATWALIALVYCVERFYWRGTWLFAMETISAAAIPLFVLSVPYVLWLDRKLVEPRDGAWHFGALLIGREPYDMEQVWHHLRAWAVKGFFTAFMISILPFGFAGIVNLELSELPGNPVRVASAMIEMLFLIDVQIAMVGYLLTMKPLDSHIRSANPHLAGWVAALICYPPLIQMGGNGIMDYHPGSGEWALFLEGHTAVLWVWGAMLAVLTGIYAWATVIYGIRFSNLTYRGVVTNGPYRLTRHPAYLSKNLFWWMATLPFLTTTGSMVDAVRNTLLLAAVSATYYWRAKTEEKHLLAEDPKYAEYHAWMGQNAPITRGLSRLWQWLRPRDRQLQPAE